MINSVVFQGRLVRDVDIKTVGDNISVAEFTIAWSEKYKDKESKCFLRCKAWRGTAEFVDKYFTKGQELIVEGNLLTEEWEDKETQKKQSKTILNVQKAHFCGKKSDNADAVPSGFTEIKDDSEQDIPF